MTGKRFSRLSDGIAKRRYAIGKITMTDGRECSLIEVEREDRALSMLLLKSNKLVKWEYVCSILLLGLVDESGKWSNDIIGKIRKEGIVVNRIKHLSKIKYETEEYIYGKIE